MSTKNIQLIKNLVLVIVTYALVYYKIRDFFIGIETPIDALYFSLIFSSTIGTGEIQPINNIGKLAIILNVITLFVVFYVYISSKY